MGVTADPVRTWVRRWPRSIAQYEIGHAARAAAVRERAARHPGLVFAGTALDGVSFNSAVRSAAEVARHVGAAIASEAARAERSASVAGAPAPSRSMPAYGEART